MRPLQASFVMIVLCENCSNPLKQQASKGWVGVVREAMKRGLC